VQPGLVEPGIDGLHLTAQVGELCGQGGQALALSAGQGVSGPVRGHHVLLSSSAYR
jgi:hypothetical protein